MTPSRSLRPHHPIERRRRTASRRTPMRQPLSGTHFPRVLLCLAVALLVCIQDHEAYSQELRPTPSTLERLNTELSLGWSKTAETVLNASQQVAPLAQEVQQQALDQWLTAYRMEYKVAEISGSEPLAKVEQTLQILGEERWDCFAVQSLGSSTRLFCKRRPQSFLRLMSTLPSVGSYLLGLL